MRDLVVRAYNVGFGDAVLVSIPERDAEGAETTRHILFDVGNLLAGSKNADAVFETVVADIIQRTGGEVDLYVMTHEHLDHVQGLLYAATKGLRLGARYAWLTGSSDPDYYDRHPSARKRRLEMDAALGDASRVLQSGPDAELDALLRNNAARLETEVLGLKTSDYIDHLRTIAPADRTLYVDRTTDLTGRHPFGEAKLTVLAPEEDTTDYYGRLPQGGTLTATSEQRPVARRSQRALAALPEPPPGVDPGAFFDLVRSRRSGLLSNLFEIDAANNNTSLVLLIEWRGWRLLFPGDAELRSWSTMHTLGLLAPVHVVKVSHHGSHNGTMAEVFDALLPAQSPDGRERFALLSTAEGSFASVPDSDTLDFYRSRCTVRDTRDVPPGAAVEVVLPG